MLPPRRRIRSYPLGDSQLSGLPLLGFPADRRNPRHGVATASGQQGVGFNAEHDGGGSAGQVGDDAEGACREAGRDGVRSLGEEHGTEGTGGGSIRKRY